ncbi:hypothetical protein M426DRAFT_183679 [Hypoxylon sp. CI-4A]|nr:hypothetical protein M426DRAFT_183679 [Hypoxylon sp. CI-4A]
MTTAAETAGISRPCCNRCKEKEGSIDLRGAERVCETCFTYYVSTKAVKRLEALQKAAPRTTAVGPRRTQRYLVGLSRGPSSTALLHVLTENVRQRASSQKPARFECVAAVHVVDDTATTASSASGTGDALSLYRARFPEARFLTVPLSSALDLPSSAIDWAALPAPTPSPSLESPAQRLSDILNRLPSATSRADVRRLLVRHLLLATAASQTCDALLLGHSTTSLAELTLSETAKGRGYSLPWLVNDGFVPIPDHIDADASSTTSDGVSNPADTPAIAIYSPLRELFRKELRAYISRTSPPLAGILPPSEADEPPRKNGGGAVVSHRDLSIDDVLSRYFGEVEASYPSVVANVVRTTGKLSHPGPGSGDGNGNDNGEIRCGLCGAALDELGDERWRGEIGDREEEEEVGNGEKSKLCYGCERSIRG